MKKNKKASIGTTLTWIAAFLIIFFIMTLFLVATMFISGGKDVDVSAQTYASNLKSQRVLFNLLDSRVSYENKEMTIKELIEKWPEIFENDDSNEEIKNKIQEEIEKIIEDSLVDDDGYYFYSELGIAEREWNQKLEEYYKKTSSSTMTAGAKASIIPTKNMLKGTLEFHKFDGKCPFEGEKDIMLVKASNIYLFSEGEKINLKLYVGKCEKYMWVD